MTKRVASLMALLLLVIGATVAPVSARKAAKGKSYEPPYKAGPSGGDDFNFSEADPSSGNMTVLRLFPGVPPVTGCAPEPSAAWSMFRVKHKVTAPVSEVSVAYTAAVGAYGWITVGARDAKGEWLGVRKRQGPLAESGELTAKLFDKPSRGETITVEFGLQLGDACPQVESASAMFPSVTVK